MYVDSWSNKMIIAIDPGTHCRWTIELTSGCVHSGTWMLMDKRLTSPGMRFLALKKELETLATVEPITMLFFEEVRRHVGTHAAHVYGGLIATLMLWCEERSIPYMSIPVATIKKHATGKGNADKEKMVAAAKKKWANIKIKDDNQADALWILDCGKELVLL